MWAIDYPSQQATVRYLPISIVDVPEVKPLQPLLVVGASIYPVQGSKSHNASPVFIFTCTSALIFLYKCLRVPW